MKMFHTILAKNVIKSLMVSIGALASFAGLRTELTIIMNDIAIATWVSIVWAVMLIGTFAYYKSKLDEELDRYREFEKNRHTLGLAPVEQPKEQGRKIGWIDTAVEQPKEQAPKIGDPVFLKETLFTK